VRRLIALLVPAFLLIPLSALPASADKPIREPLIAEDFTVEGSCDFPVFVDFVANHEFIKTFFDKDGNVTDQMITGHLTQNLTNLDTGKTIFYNVSGPGFLIFFEDGSLDFVLGGRSSVFLFPGQVEGLPLFFVNSGQVTLHLDAEGNLVSVEQVGHIEDVCAALA
jgi:hypothetical protein